MFAVSLNYVFVPRFNGLYIVSGWYLPLTNVRFPLLRGFWEAPCLGMTMLGKAAENQADRVICGHNKLS